MTDRIPVFVYASDPLSRAGIVSQLRNDGGLLVLEESDVDRAAVALVVADEIDDEAARVIKAMQRNSCPRVVAVVARLDDVGLLAAIEAGTCGFVRRSEAVTENLSKAIAAAASGDGTVPPDLLGRLLSQVGTLQRQVLAPRGLTMMGLSERELSVLKLVADGCDTSEVANELCYSERTVKNVIHDVTSRLGLRNRTHAVAFALRQGFI